MKHLCNCGEIVEVEGDTLKVATCKNCGMYYIYASEIVPPYEEDEQLLKNIQSKVHSTHAIVVEEDAVPYIPIPEDNDFMEEDDEEMPVKVKPRAAKRR